MTATHSKKLFKKYLYWAFALVLLILINIFLVGPFIMILSDSFKSSAEIAKSVPTIIPREFTTAHFQELFSDKMFVTNMQNSLKVALITMFIAMLLALPTAYAMARYRSKITSGMVVWIILSQMIPGIITIVPVYNILKLFALTNTHAGLIIGYAIGSLPFSCWMMRGFISGVPKELEEAALIDGCGTVMMITRILIPVILPGILTAGVFAFVNAWNELFFALCLMKDPALQTLPIKLNSYIGIAGQSRAGMVAAGSLVSSIPGIIVFVIFQRFFVTGLTSGSVK